MNTFTSNFTKAIGSSEFENHSSSVTKHVVEKYEKKFKGRSEVVKKYSKNLEQGLKLAYLSGKCRNEESLRVKTGKENTAMLEQLRREIANQQSTIEALKRNSGGGRRRRRCSVM